jgi:hypothetical protein
MVKMAVPIRGSNQKWMPGDRRRNDSERSARFVFGPAGLRASWPAAVSAQGRWRLTRRHVAWRRRSNLVCKHIVSIANCRSWLRRWRACLRSASARVSVLLDVWVTRIAHDHVTRGV